MKRNKLSMLVIAAAISISCVSSSSLATNNGVKTYSKFTLAGQDRYETSSKISLEYIKTNNSGVILAFGENFPDALSGSVLAQKYKMPLLLAGNSVETSKTALSYIEQNLDKDKTIYILGGNGGIKDEVKNKLLSMGYTNIKRICGQDRFETNAAVFDEFNAKKGTPIVIASGENFPDALSISPIAAEKGYPILLANKDNVPDIIKKKIKETKPSLIYVIGGTGSVSESTLNTIETIAELDSSKIVRISGSDRYATSLSVARYFDMNSDTVTFANGTGFADALSGSALSAQKNAPLVLVNVENAYNQKKYVDSQKKYTKETFYGGNGVISSKVKDYLSKDYDPSNAQEAAPGVTQTTNVVPTPQPSNTPPVVYSPSKNWTPKLPKVSNASPVADTTQLTNEDISRLQSYPQYLTAGGSTSEVAASFQDLYTNKPKSCESILQKFSPIKFEDYKNAKVEWLTKPSLVYKNAIAQYCIRGIIQLTFYSDNKFGLKTNQKYECDVEYDVTYGVFNGKSQAVLGSVDYLSDFKPVQ